MSSHDVLARPGGTERQAGLTATIGWLGLALLATCAGSARADVAQLDAWTERSNTDPANAFSVAVPGVTVSAGVDRLFVVAAVLESSAAGTVSAFSADLGGAALTPAATTETISGRVGAKLWYLRNASIPGLPATLTVSGTHTANLRRLRIYTASFSGVDQASPLSGSAANAAAATSVTFGSAVSYVGGGLTVLAAGNGGTPATLTGPAGFTVRITTTGSNLSSFVADSGLHVASSSYAAGTTVTFGGTTQSRSAVAVMSLRPSPVCATPGSAGPGGTLSGVVNSYWPGTASVAAGATSVTVGARTGAAAGLVAGDLVLVIQMQDAAIDSTNSTSYGDGVAGEPVTGSTALDSTGLYEFARVTSTGGGWTDAGGGTINLASSGAGGGLVNAYNNANASGTRGQRRFQVIRVPQFSSASLASATALPWSTNATAPIGLGTGGVLVLDVAGALDVTGTTCDVSGLGFRGGGGRQLTGGAGANTDVRTSSAVNNNGAKGEGIAGTPAWVAGPAGPIATNQPNEGYPNGSNARGAPGNAGGGSTDGNPGANDQNSGGGGGGNGGAGARGGNSWSSNLVVGGSGGAGYGASATRLLMGGGGGAGTRNNTPCDAQAAAGAAGGGIVILRAGQITGTGTIRANGADAYNFTSNDSGGGGGAGGTIVLIANTGDFSGVTAIARGGRGGDAWARPNCSGTLGASLGDRHGPGGGGGGGVVVSRFPVGTVDVAGGLSGVTTTLNDGFGTEPGAAGGVTSIVISGSDVPGVGGGLACACDPAIAITHTPDGGSPGGNLASNSSGFFTATVTNVAPYLPTSGTTTVTLSIPAGLTPVASAAGQTLGGPGWTNCTILGQSVSCERSDSVAPGAAYPPMVVPFTTGSGPALFTTTASLSVSGGTNANYNLANDSATDTALLLSPTLARMGEVRVAAGAGGTVVTWRTSFEVDNLGFRVFREDGGRRTERTPELIGGSALFAGRDVTLTAGRQYRFVDPEPAPEGSAWWIEEIDLRGRNAWHGPFRAEPGVGGEDDDPAGASPAISGLSVAPRPEARAARPAGERALGASALAAGPPGPVQAALAAGPAAKIAVAREGWYRVTRAELAAAGFDPGPDPTSLRLYAEAVEQAIVVEGAGDGSFDPGDAIRFYGLGLDTPSTDRRVYWLVGGGAAGLRAPAVPPPAGPAPPAEGFATESVYAERFVYFPALTTAGERGNFFGPVVGPSGTNVAVASPAAVAAGTARLVVRLQGGTAQSHTVAVSLGGNALGTMTAIGIEAFEAAFAFPAGWLGATSTVTLRSLDGANDFSLVDVLRLEYTRRYEAAGDFIAFTAAPGSVIAVPGFTTASVHVVDVSDPARPVVLSPAMEPGPGGYTATVQVPPGGGARVLALADGLVRAPAAVEPNASSRLAAAQPGGMWVAVTHPSLAPALGPLVSRRTREWLVTKVVDVTDVYDEFSYGAKDPAAIREFLRSAASLWTYAPRYVLLLGDASFDPRNHLGLGSLDLVPTAFVPTKYLMTASDDALADVAGTSEPSLAIGRLPARSLAEAERMLGKVLARSVSPPSPGVLLAADATDGFDFAAATREIAAALPASVPRQIVDGSALATPALRAALVQALQAGPAWAAWVGHGSEATLGKSTVFGGADALALTNATPMVFVAADCLNGFFQDVYGESLAESLLKAPNGGAAAVWASSGLTEPAPQAEMTKAFFAAVFGPPAPPRLGDAVLAAKRAIADRDVKRTWILLGDPGMRAR